MATGGAESCFVVGNVRTQEHAPVDDRGGNLEAQIEQLRAEVRDLSELLLAERAHRTVLQRAVGYATARARALERTEGGDSVEVLALGRPRGNSIDRDSADLYVFDDEDEAGAAFDEFFATPDPHLEKVRGFLLD